MPGNPGGKGAGGGPKAPAGGWPEGGAPGGAGWGGLGPGGGIAPGGGIGGSGGGATLGGGGCCSSCQGASVCIASRWQASAMENTKGGCSARCWHDSGAVFAQR